MDDGIDEVVMKMTSSIVGGMVTTLKCYSNPEGSEMKRLFKLTEA